MFVTARRNSSLLASRLNPTPPSSLAARPVVVIGMATAGRAEVRLNFGMSWFRPLICSRSHSAFAVFAGLMWLCGEVESCLGPGVLDGADFGVGGSERGVGRKSCGDDRAAE